MFCFSRSALALASVFIFLICHCPKLLVDCSRMADSKEGLETMPNSNFLEIDQISAWIRNKTQSLEPGPNPYFRSCTKSQNFGNNSNSAKHLSVTLITDVDNSHKGKFWNRAATVMIQTSSIYYSILGLHGLSKFTIFVVHYSDPSGGDGSHWHTQ